MQLRISDKNETGRGDICIAHTWNEPLQTGDPKNRPKYKRLRGS